MKAPRNWRKLERHNLSAEYADIKGKAWEEFKENLLDIGIVNKRKITLYESKILDGWQLFRACIECNISPEFQPLPKGMDPEKFVAAMQDHRRHETQEVAMARTAKRRERVAAARAEGKSERQIAEEEGVSQKTIHQDIEKTTDTGVSVGPISGQITGKDGKKRAAPIPKSAAEKQRDAAAKRLAKQAAAAGVLQVSEDESITDTIKRVNGQIENFCRELIKFVDEHLPRDPWLNDMDRRAGAIQKFKDGCEMLRSCKCHSACPRCKGEKKYEGKKCDPCKGTGRVTKYQHDQMV